mmetsp:Transcript_4953/g.17935  ORF Transcript_4953/g.17935 Transcript_4953/m.17935 type:complete len:689 (+) Transcript_4953:94-2160(+)
MSYYADDPTGFNQAMGSMNLNGAAHNAVMPTQQGNDEPNPFGSGPPQTQPNFATEPPNPYGQPESHYLPQTQAYQYQPQTNNPPQHHHAVAVAPPTQSTPALQFNAPPSQGLNQFESFPQSTGSHGDPFAQPGGFQPEFEQPPTQPQWMHWFQLADQNEDQKISGQEAVNFLKYSSLPQSMLSKIWTLSDQYKRGCLGPDEFRICLGLVGLAQNGLEISVQNLQSMSQPPQPRFAPAVEDLAATKGQRRNRPQPPVIAPAGKQSRRSAREQSERGRQVEYTMRMESVTNIVDGLKHMYSSKVKPIEEATGFHIFHSPLLTDSEFEAKPCVLLLGQYSVGKTTFIKYLLGREYPTAQIGPEPTTDRFVAVCHSHEEGITPGNTLVVQKDKPFTGLSKFGTAFLNKFAASELPADLLEHITLIDTPGVLSGEKQRIERQYDFPSIVEWFAERSDLILLLFDPHKLDISDEFKRAINSVRGNDDKVRVVLNKADGVDTQQLMRVYGALMWSLSRVVRTPEVLRVYIGNFSDREYECKDNADLLDKERGNLLQDILDIPRRSVARKINEFVKRVRAAKIHAYLVHHLREKVPTFGKDKAQAKEAARMEEVFKEVSNKYALPPGDFPSVSRFRDKLSDVKIYNYKRVDIKQIQALDNLLSEELPALLQRCGNPFDSGPGGDGRSGKPAHQGFM